MKDPKNTCLPVVGHGMVLNDFFDLCQAADPSKCLKSRYHRDFHFLQGPRMADVSFVLRQNHLNRLYSTPQILQNASDHDLIAIFTFFNVPRMVQI